MTDGQRVTWTAFAILAIFLLSPLDSEYQHCLPQCNPHVVISIRLMGQKILLIVTTAILATCTATMATYYFFFPPLTSRATEIEMRGEILIYGEV